MLSLAATVAAQTLPAAPAPGPSLTIPRASTPPTLADYLDGVPRPDEVAITTFVVNPWTAVYAGYSDGYANLEIDPLSRDRLRVTDSVFHSTGRQVFVKLSYILRF